MLKSMINELDDNKIFYNPGDCVTIRHNIANKPEMWVVEKISRSIYNNDTKEKENIFLWIKCRWFDDNKCLQEGLFSTKDLIKL